MSNATILRIGMLDMQICVPSDWTDEQAEEFANSESPSGTSNGWVMMHNGHKYLGGDSERVVCSENKNNVHIRLEC